MPDRWLYLEFLVPMKDYTETLDRKEFVFDWIFPLILSLLIYFFLLRSSTYSNETGVFTGNVLNVLGVLFGFSIASITLLITSSSDTIKLIKEKRVKNRTINGKSISVYQLTIITFTFLLFLELFGIIFNFLLALLVLSSPEFWESSWKIFCAVDFLILAQVVALNVRNTTNIYFVFLEPFRTK